MMCVQVCLALLLLSSLVSATTFASSCPVRFDTNACSNASQPEELFECLGRYLFHQPSGGIVVHTCGETGWGNAFAGLGNAASVALTLGYRLNVVHSAFNRLFILPPHADQHAYPAEAAFASIKRVGFDYERDGRNGKFAEFSRDVQSLALRNLKHRYQNEALLESRICGADSSFLTTGECVSSLLSAFTHCAQSYAMPSPFYNIPFAHTLFSQPTQRMSHIMATLRQRIGLPPAPLHQGIRDQAHFVLALQFRNSPIGFEPSAADGEQRKLRESLLSQLWVSGTDSIRQASSVAACRNQSLLIVFATDDITLRVIAVQKWASLGRLVFLLKHKEIGHMAPLWPASETSSACSTYNFDSATSIQSHLQSSDFTVSVSENMNLVDRSETATRRHADWGFGEWFALGSAQWLIVGSGSSYATSAVALGFGPRGATERFDMIGQNGARSWYRLDWHGQCRQVRPKVCPIP